MAKKALIKDSESVILPITRGELVLDSSGKLAFHSESFLADNSLPGLISKENYLLLNTLNNSNSVKVLVNSNNKIEWVAPDILNEFLKTPTNVDLSTAWSDEAIVIFNTDFSNGLYLIKITLDNLIFSGVASVYVGDINVDDEIVLHASGISSDDFRIYAKIANAGDYGGLYLSANKNRSAITNLSITMKKMI